MMYQLSRREEEILLTVWNLKEDAYLVKIRSQISRISGKELTIGAIHLPLNSMEKSGLISSVFGESTKKRGGRRKRIYTITKSGFDALRESKKKQNQFWEDFSKEFQLDND
jgi:DNA-binding PadR family transcriptional regulator